MSEEVRFQDEVYFATTLGQAREIAEELRVEYPRKFSDAYNHKMIVKHAIRTDADDDKSWYEIMQMDYRADAFFGKEHDESESVFSYLTFWYSFKGQAVPDFDTLNSDREEIYKDIRERPSIDGMYGMFGRI